MKASKSKAAKARAELGDLTAQLAEVAALKGQALIDRYTQVMGKAPKSKNQHFLRKRIAIELQCKASGHPTPDEKARIKEVQAYGLEHGLWPDIRKGETRAKKPAATTVVSMLEPATPAASDRDPRLPPVGTVLTREHGNRTHEVTVMADGFEYAGERYMSLSKVARVITGTTWNGWLFFGLTGRKSKGAA